MEGRPIEGRPMEGRPTVGRAPTIGTIEGTLMCGRLTAGMAIVGRWPGSSSEGR